MGCGINRRDAFSYTLAMTAIAAYPNRYDHAKTLLAQYGYTEVSDAALDSVYHSHTGEIVTNREDIEAVAQRVVELLMADALPTPVIVDARTLAARLRVSRDFVYRHARELGGVALTAGEKPRWRFDVSKALQAHERITDPALVRAPRHCSTHSSIPLLPVHEPLP